MKIWAYLVVVVNLIFALNIFSAPKLRFETGDTVNFGKLRNVEDMLKKKVKIFNDGTDTLKILAVRPGCGCTAAPLNKKEIEPRGFAEMDISLILSNKPGKYTKSIYIQTNDPERTETYLYLTAEIEPALKFFPDTKILASNILARDTSSYKLIMQNMLDEDLIIRDPKYEPEGTIATNLPETLILKPKEEFTLEVRVFPTSPGNYSGKIKIKTSAMDLPRVEIPIYGLVTGFKK